MADELFVDQNEVEGTASGAWSRMLAGNRRFAEGKPEHPSDYQDNIVKDSIKSLETVVYEGVKCRVITFVDKEDGATAKMWLREDYGLPMKQEVVSKKGEKMTIEYKNMKIGAQAADLFKLPAGVKVQDMNAMMQNMPKNKQ